MMVSRGFPAVQSNAYIRLSVMLAYAESGLRPHVRGSHMGSVG